VNTQSATVFVVDDDPDVRRALTRLLRAANFAVSPYGSAREFLAAHDPEAPGCLVLDVSMPGMNGLDLQQSLRAAGSERPIIFLTGSGDIPTSACAMQSGAVTFLTKPASDFELFEAVTEALRVDAEARRGRR
jgi:FixJ family two-component response regulator